MAEEKASSPTNPASPGNGNGSKGTHFKILRCIDCKEEFGITADAQGYLEGKSPHHTPKRCRACHQKFKREQEKLHPPPPPEKPEDSYRVVKEIRNPQGLKKAW